MINTENLLFGIEEALVLPELQSKLAKGEPLTIKAGFDPTAADLHLGHLVLLQKMRQFQLAGHQVVFIIGDYTAMIGDPTGKNVTRKILTESEIKQNALTYEQQLSKVLDISKTKILFNSQWLAAMSAKDLILLAGKSTVARMLERDDFCKRFQTNQAIAIHEFLYPLLQGYDSVAVKADIELGGTDQKFNLLMGRNLQREFKQAPQVVMTLPIIEGLDGVNKMSKSLGNYIGIAEDPVSMYGKIMSISDSLMWRYIKVLGPQNHQHLEKLQAKVEAGHNPKLIKSDFAEYIVTLLHDAASAELAKAHFDNLSNKGQPTDMPSYELAYLSAPRLVHVLKAIGLIASTSIGNRLIKQQGIKVDNKKIIMLDYALDFGIEYTIQVGKRQFAKVKLTKQEPIN